MVHRFLQQTGMTITNLIRREVMTAVLANIRRDDEIDELEKKIWEANPGWVPEIDDDDYFCLVQMTPDDVEHLKYLATKLGCSENEVFVVMLHRLVERKLV